MNKFRIIIETPPGLIDPAIAIAGSRAGGIGVLNLEFGFNNRTCREQIEKLSQYVAGNDFGVKVGQDSALQIFGITARLPKHFRLAVLSGIFQGNLKETVSALRDLGLEVLLECTTLKEARAAEQAGADGVIAKGHEAGGRMGDETAFILLQSFIQHLTVPVCAKGGIGVHTASSCFAAGAVGIVLDSQVALTRESPLPGTARDRIAAMDGSETICLGDKIGHPYRVCSRMGMSAIKELRELERTLLVTKASNEEIESAWHQAVSKYVGCEYPDSQLFLFGQDIAFAAPLAKKYITVGGILEAIRQGIDSHCRAAHTHRPMEESSPLAASHGTRYPVVQGPMARVSDVPAFACEVAKNGGLPFVSASWMERGELETLLQETGALLNGRAWGVGLLGFLPAEVYKDQIQAVISHCPPFALIAGGLPSQAKELEKEGVSTYLHVPSQGLMRMFLDEGIKRFVFEGREAGGHVGPLSSFVLWNLIIDLLLEYLESHADPGDYHLLFAGGIHDALSASMVAVMAAPLAERGVRIGIQLGSAYLFCRESVATAAIVEQYQQEAMRCESTKLLVTGPGHVERCMDTPFARSFKQEKVRLIKEGASGEVQKEILERFKLGRLLIASRGMAENFDNEGNPGKPYLLPLTPKEQYRQGNYMIGQLAALRAEQVTIDVLHRDVTVKAGKRVAALDKCFQKFRSGKKKVSPCNVAIIGMACLFPKAGSLQVFWENILNKIRAIREVPRNRWDPSLYFDSDQHAQDRVYSRWGTFLDDIHFDPLKYGMVPNSLNAIEPLQLLTLEVVNRALEDAGYIKRPFPRENTSVILGLSGAGELEQLYSLRTMLPMLFGEKSPDIVAHFDGILPEWTEDSFPGILMNVAAGRVANRFDLGGLNCSVDGACASSLVAVHSAIQELEARTSDMVIVGAADCTQNPFAFMCFSKTQALSPRGECNCLDEEADGIVVGEGIGVMVLKRLADAERDGDRIYAVIKAVGAASDGRDKSLTAPSPNGQIRALQRAYDKAGISPNTVELIEAHATGTAVGDRTEIESLGRVFKDAGSRHHSCSIGSIKSMIGHTKSTAGLASLIKTTLALHHKVLPPTIGVKKPNKGLCSSDSPFYINSDTLPWVHHQEKFPRRAGVSAFGFGGTNFHAVLEEYTGDFLDHLNQPSFCSWPAELLLFKGTSRQELFKAVTRLVEALDKGAEPPLGDLAVTLWSLHGNGSAGSGKDNLRLAVVASSHEDLKQKLVLARKVLQDSQKEICDPRGIYFTQQPLAGEGKVAFLFPGQGSQYVNMFADLAVQFPMVRALFERSDRLLEGKLPGPLSRFVFPPTFFTKDEKRSCAKALAQAHIAQPAVGTADLAMFYLLASLGVHPEMVAGHSYGEYAALCAAGVFNTDDLIVLSEARGSIIVESAGENPGAMAAISVGKDDAGEVLKGIDGIWIANVNAPKQTVVSGTGEAVEEAIGKFKSSGIHACRIPVACAFHSPVVSGASERLRECLAGINLGKPCLTVYSNTTARPYPNDYHDIAELLVRHLAEPVEFVRQIEAMYADGARIFVEAGPGSVLSGLARQILADRQHLALVSNQAARPGLVQLQHLLGQLMVHGVPLEMDRLYSGRGLKAVDLESLYSAPGQKDLPPTTWLVNGARAKPVQSDQDQAIRPMELTPREKELPRTKHTQTVQSEFPDFAQKNNQETSPESGTRELKSFSHAPAPDDGTEQVMLRYQQLMNRFLEIQKRNMLAYLKRNGDVMPTSHGFMETDLEENKQTRPLHPDIQTSVEHARADMPSQYDLQAASRAPAGTSEADSVGIRALSSRQELTQRLLAIVSDKTGYPQEMLGLDVNLEAELGIDSIKQVEILGLFMNDLFPAGRGGPPEELMSLKKVRTLVEIIDVVDSYRVAPGGSGAADDSSPDLTMPPETCYDFSGKTVLPRLTLTTVESPLHGKRAGLAPDRVIMITDDGGGVARELTSKLRDRGFQVALVTLEVDREDAGQDSYILKNISEEGIGMLVEAVRQRQGAVGSLIHLFPLKKSVSYRDIDLTGWRKRLEMEVKPVFHLLKLLEKDLNKAARNWGGCVITATGMGGSFACSQNAAQPDFFPGNACVTGFLKTVAEEWPDVRLKSLDLCMDEPASLLADHIMAEIEASDGLMEVGYNGSGRLTLGLLSAPLTVRTESFLSIDSSWVILVTGGARGITAEVARELASRYQPTMILAGRSPLPILKEATDTAGLTLQKDLKAALIAKKRENSTSFTLPDIEAEYRQLLKDREIRANMTAMRDAGACVTYFQVDVRNEESFGKLIDDIYKVHKRLDGVIHGAGLLEDKLLTDKSWESFDRVFGTKTESAFTLSRKLRPDMLKFLVLFSSVAGRIGNPGQCDYTSANEVLNKLAVYLNRTWPGRVLAINWGPWEGTGMVNDGIRRQFAERGIGLIAPSAGRVIFDMEIQRGQKDEVEVVIGEGPWQRRKENNC